MAFRKKQQAAQEGGRPAPQAHVQQPRATQSYEYGATAFQGGIERRWEEAWRRARSGQR